MEDMAPTLPSPGVETETAPETANERSPLYHVVLFDDDEHSYAYVVEMMRVLFDMSAEEGFEIAYEVDHIGQAVVKTCPHEEAVAAQKAITSYGPDYRMENSQGSMGCVIEPADG